MPQSARTSSRISCVNVTFVSRPVRQSLLHVLLCLSDLSFATPRRAISSTLPRRIRRRRGSSVSAILSTALRVDLLPERLPSRLYARRVRRGLSTGTDRVCIEDQPHKGRRMRMDLRCCNDPLQHIRSVQMYPLSVCPPVLSSFSMSSSGLSID